MSEAARIGGFDDHLDSYGEPGIEDGPDIREEARAERARIEQSNEVAGIVFDEHKKAWPDLHPVLDLRYGIADALWAAGYRKSEVTFAAEYVDSVNLLLDALGVTDEYLPPDIVACGCEAEQGIRHLIWHLSERASRKPEAAPSDTDQDVRAWIDKTLALPMYQNAISEYGQGVVETLRAVRKLLDGRMHPDTRATLRTSQPVQVEVTGPSAEQAWREGYYTGKRDYAASITGGLSISTPNPHAALGGGE